MAYLFQMSALDTFRTSGGALMPGSRLAFYNEGTTVAASTYTDETGDTEHTWPVVADINGVFPAIYLDEDSAYRVKLFDATQALNSTPLRDRDNIKLPARSDWATDTELAALESELNNDMDTLEAEIRAFAVQRTADRTSLASEATGTNKLFYLCEAGRQGLFKWTSGDLSAEVTADTYQAIYVPPASDTDGSSGAWVREVPDNVYQFSWTGVTAATANATLQLENFLDNTDLVPDGAEFVFPPHALTMGPTARSPSSLRGISRGNVIIRGHGYKSHLILDYANTGAVDLLYLRTGSNIAVRDIRFTGEETSLSQNPSCIRFGTQSSSVEPTLQENVEVSGCFFDNTSLGIVVSSTTGPTQNLRCTNVKIFNNHIESNGQGVSLFGAENVEVFGNILNGVNATLSNLCAPFRCIGSHNVLIADNDCRGTTEYAMFGGGASRGSGFEMTSENVSLINNKFRNCISGAIAMTSGVSGRFVIRGNTFVGDISSTASSTAAYLTVTDLDQGAGTVLYYFDQVIIENNEFIGYYTSVFCDGPGSSTPCGKYLLLKDNLFIGNAGTAGSGAGLLIWSQFNCFSLMDVVGNHVLQPASSAIADAGYAIQCANMSGQHIRAFSNHLPEGFAGTTMFGTGGTPGTLEGAIYDGTTVGADNRVYPSGSYAAAT